MRFERCPVCGAREPAPTEHVRGYQLARCGSCALEFTINPEYQLEGYEAGYSGMRGILEDPLPYAAPGIRLALEARAWRLPPPYLTAAERWVLRRLRGRLPAGATVVDVGCGTGRFLRACRRVGLQAVGIDPAPSVVEHLAAMGFTAHVGAAPGLEGLVEGAAAVTAFEVLEHLPDPIPVIGEIRRCFPGAPSYEFLRGLARRAGRYLYPLARIAGRRASLILVQNPETRDWLPRRHSAKTVVFPNAITLHLDGIAPREPRDPSGTLVALFAGRLLPWKGLALALRALRLLPDWRLVVLGSGPDLPRLQRLARRYGVEDREEFRGWQPREEVLHALREEADVFLFPSLHDESPLAVAEALAIGLPVVFLDHGGLPAVARALGAVELLDGHSRPIAQALQQASRLLAVGFRPVAGGPSVGPHARLSSLVLEVVGR